MKIHLVRHPQTVDNAAGIMAGHTNSKVTPLGKKQVKLVAKRLAKEPFEIIYCSDLTRCKEIALAVKKLRPKTRIIFTKKLRERNFGIYEGLHFQEFDVLERSSNGGELKFRPKKGESNLDVRKRMKKFITQIEKKKHKHILVITHGGVKRAFFDLISKKQLFGYKNNYNTCVSFVEHKRIKYVGDISHLPKYMHTI